MKGCRCDLIVGQIVDGVLPEGEAGAPFRQDEAHPRRTARPGASFVVQQHRDAGVHQTPVVFADAFVQIGQRGADVDLGRERNSQWGDGEKVVSVLWK